MKKFHSTVTRRDFMKALGFGVAGLGAAAAAAPVFHDLDEVIGSYNSDTPTATMKRPWWVTERDFLNPTAEVDWSIMQRMDRMYEGHSKNFHTQWITNDDWNAINPHRAVYTQRRLDNQEPGADLKWQALSEGDGMTAEAPDWEYAGLANQDDWATSAAERGLPRYTGTPEENSRLVTAALRFFGITYIGYANLDSTWRNKLIVQNTTSASSSHLYNGPIPESEQLRYVYEDVDRAYAEIHPNKEKRNAGKLVIPTKDITMIFMAVTGSAEGRKYPTLISNGNRIPRTNHHEIVAARLFNFMRVLGDYQVFGLPGHQEMSTNLGASAVLTGVSESSRQNNYTLTPEQGNAFNPFNLHTDMVIAPTKPIDAGIFKFCHSCGICARACPSGSISEDKEPSWEINERDGKPMNCHNPGVKHFWSDFVSCVHQYTAYNGCGVASEPDGGPGRVCFAVCPFNSPKAALIHDVVRATAATTSLFNGFIVSMAGAFGYGESPDPDDWWDQSLPAYGMRTDIGAGTGGY